MTEISVFEAAGGMPGLVRLAQAHHERCLADPVLEHPFSRAKRTDHVERLARYWAEILGGPPALLYPESGSGTQVPMLAMHSGQGMDDDLGDRFLACFLLAMDDAQLPDDPRLRRVLREYMEWATADVMSIAHVGDVPPAEAPMPRWSWSGREV